MTTQITSSLDLREVLRTVAANIREVIHADAVVVSLPDTASGKFKIFAVDFPHGKGVLKEELLVTLSAPVKKAIETLKPVLFDRCEPDMYGPILRTEPKPNKSCRLTTDASIVTQKQILPAGLWCTGS